MSTRPALGLARFACGLLLPAMREDLRWSLAEAGALNTANELGYLLGAAAPASAAEAGFPCSRRRRQRAPERLGAVDGRARVRQL